MKSINLIIVLIIMWGCNNAQTNSKSIIKDFTNELRAGQVSNTDLIEKYFTFSKSLGDDEKKKAVIPILTNQFDLIREKLNAGCSKLEIFDYTYDSDLTRSLKLKVENFDPTNVYYISCDDLILIPVLIEGTKIMSIMTYAKSENGSQTFVVF